MLGLKDCGERGESYRQINWDEALEQVVLRGWSDGESYRLSLQQKMGASEMLAEELLCLFSLPMSLEENTF